MASVLKEMEKDVVYEKVRAANNVLSGAGPKVSKKKSKPPPNLEELLENLEKANSHPSRALDHLKNLALNADEIVQKIDFVDQTFAPN